MNLPHRCDCNLICQFRKLTAVKKKKEEEEEKKKKKQDCMRTDIAYYSDITHHMYVSLVYHTDFVLHMHIDIVYHTYILSSTCMLILFIIQI